jgi:phage portal protein BeeE
MLSLIACGDAYWYKVRNKRKELIGFVLLDHSAVKPLADKYHDPANNVQIVTYYEYRNPDGAIYELPPSDVVHFRYGLNPVDQKRGLSPIVASLREIVTDNVASELGVSLLRNGGIPGIAFEPTDSLEDMPADKKVELERRIGNRISGAGAGTPIVMPFPGQWKVIGFSPDKLVLTQQRGLAVSRMLAAIGLDPMVLGLPSENKTYSNYAEANEAAVENCFLPMLSLIARTLTRQVLLTDYVQRQTTNKVRVGWDLSDIRALQPDYDALYERAGKAFERDMITRMEAKLMLGLKVDPSRDDVYKSESSLVEPMPEQNSRRERYLKAVKMMEEADNL